MKTDKYRLERISETGHQLLEVAEEYSITSQTLTDDFKLQWLVATPLFNIGEQVNCLSSEFVSEHPDQPWSSIAGLRHRLVHNYEGTNWNMIAEVLASDLPDFIEAIDALLLKPDNENSSDSSEE